MSKIENFLPEKFLNMWKTFDTILFRLNILWNWRHYGYKIVLLKNGQTAVYIARPFCGSVVYTLYDIDDRILARKVLSWSDFRYRIEILRQNGWILVKNSKKNRKKGLTNG